MFRPRRPAPLKGLSFNRMIPNILTLLALIAGMTSIRYSIRGDWHAAVVAVLIAAVLDGLDGRIARLLRGTSKFGAELDSLSDFVGFGVAPAVLVYQWTMLGAEGLGWALALLFAICAALRLARFNTMLGEPGPPPWSNNFFSGVPTPAGAGLVMVPLVLSFATGSDVFRHPALVGAVLVTVSFLEVSRIPTYSFKRVRVPHRWVLPLMLLVGVLAALLVTVPWGTLSVIGIGYLATIPLSIRSYARQRRLAATEPAPTPEAGGP